VKKKTLDGRITETVGELKEWGHTSTGYIKIFTLDAAHAAKDNVSALALEGGIDAWQAASRSWDTPRGALASGRR
jgi:hypothetical protein